MVCLWHCFTYGAMGWIMTIRLLSILAVNLSSARGYLDKSELDGIPSGYVKITIENDPVEIVAFPINSMVIFHSFLLTFTRPGRFGMMTWWPHVLFRHCNAEGLGESSPGRQFQLWKRCIQPVFWCDLWMIVLDSVVFRVDLHNFEIFGLNQS